MKFKSVVFILMAAFAGSLFCSCMSNTEKKEKEIGLQLWSIRDDMKKDPVATVKAVGEMGYAFVELAGYADGKMYGMEPTEFKTLCDESGLYVLSSHTGPNVPEATEWDETMTWWDTCIEAHLAVGAKFIVKPSMGKDAYESLEGLKRYCDYYNAVGDKCNKAGIRFGYHNHAKEFTTMFEGKPLYDWMVELTSPEKVMYQLDLFWIIEGKKDPIEYFNKYPGRFELWHIKDDAEVGASGKIDFASIYAAKEVSGMKYGIVEVEDYNFTPLESVKKSLEYLNAAEFVK